MRRIVPGSLMLISMVCLPGCGAPPLYQSVLDNNIARTKNLIGQKASLEEGNNYSGFTPLISAAVSNHIEQARLLIAAGANVNAKDKEGDSVLECAIATGNAEMAMLLVEHGANVNVQRESLNDTPLGRAIQRRNYPLVRFLLEHGARLDYEPKFGTSYLSLAVRHKGYAGFEIAKILIERGAKIDWGGRSAPTLTPLLVAAEYGNADVAELLIAHGADIALRGPDGKTAQETATLHGNTEILRVLDEAAALQIKKVQEARIAAQPCRLNETGWFLLRGRCAGGLAHGAGEAESEDRASRWVGTFEQGRFVDGAYWQNGQLLYKGPLVSGKFHGQGVCGEAREPCEWQAGVRIDAVYQARQLRLAAEARERIARQELARLEAQQEKEERLSKALQDCERRAQLEADDNTSASCDDEGNLETYRHNRGSQARNARIFDAFNQSMDEIQRQANARVTIPNGVNSSSRSGASTKTNNTRAADNTQLMYDIQDARRKLELAQQESRKVQNSTPQADLPKKMPVQLQPPAAAVWGEAVPEAIAACWSNKQQTTWFCDGPLQETLVGDTDITKVRDLSGCNARDGDVRDIGVSGQYRVFACGRGLKFHERDVRKRRGVDGGSNMYRCLKKDMDAGKVCRQLSDSH